MQSETYLIINKTCQSSFTTTFIRQVLLLFIALFFMSPLQAQVIGNKFADDENSMFKKEQNFYNALKNQFPKCFQSQKDFNPHNLLDFYNTILTKEFMASLEQDERFILNPKSTKESCKAKGKNLNQDVMQCLFKSNIVNVSAKEFFTDKRYYRYMREYYGIEKKQAETILNYFDMYDKYILPLRSGEMNREGKM